MLEKAGEFKHLETLVLNVHGTATPLSYVRMAPIACCRSLKFLRVSMENGRVTTHDEDLERLVSQLSQLRHLTIFGRGHINDTATPALTLQAFAIVASSCPKIESIALEVNALTRPPSPTPHPSKALKRHPRLRKIRVRESPIDDPRAAASFFDTLCGAQRFALTYWYTNRWRDGWDDVESLVHQYRKEREVGRRAEKLV